MKTIGMRPLLEAPPPRPPASLAELKVRPAGPGEAAVVRAAIAREHSLLPQPPAVWRVAFLLTDRSGAVWGVGVWNHPTARLEDQVHTLELVRYALASGLPRNTATWMLARMRAWIRRNLPEIRRLITYHDETAHTGAIYAADNWRPVYTGRVETSSWAKRPGRTARPRARKTKWEREP